jgi:hypothetical protein
MFFLASRSPKFARSHPTMRVDGSAMLEHDSMGQKEQCMMSGPIQRLPHRQGTSPRRNPVAALSLLLALAGCAGAANFWPEINPIAAKEPARRAIAAEDFVNAQGRCGAAEEAFLTGAGVGLGMTECEVARRAGIADQVDISTSPGGERLVVLTYRSGPRPGIYRFLSGRLKEIERLPEAAPPARQKKAPGRK